MSMRARAAPGGMVGGIRTPARGQRVRRTPGALRTSGMLLAGPFGADGRFSSRPRSGCMRTGKHAEALELFEGALKALEYVVPAPRADVAARGDTAYRAAVAEGRLLQGASALNGALVCLKLAEWDRAVELATLALELEQARQHEGAAADAVRTGKALFRRASAQAQLGKLTEALEDVRRARTGALSGDQGVLDLFASVACARATQLLHEKKVAAAEGMFAEAGAALDQLSADRAGAAAVAARAPVQAQVAYGMGECLAFRGAAKMAGCIS